MKVVRGMYDLLGANMTSVIPLSSDTKSHDEQWQNWRHMFNQDLAVGSKHVVGREGEIVR